MTTEGTAGPDGRRVGVLISHGFTGSPASTRPWGEHLAGLGYAVSVPRLPGHGTRWEDMLPTTYADYFREVERAYDELAARVDIVVAAGLSMGGSLVLDLAMRRPGSVAGLVVVNPAVTSTNKQLLALPVLKHVVKAFPAIGNDIKKPGADEFGYPKTPLKPLASFVAEWPRLREGLGHITVPVLMFRSAEDHVVDSSSAPIILQGLGSADVTERVLEDSYHVATLDNDAQMIFDESAAFIRKVTQT